MPLKELTGLKFDRLTVIERAPSRKGVTFWKVSCTCGTEKEVPGDALSRGQTRSCGCLRNEVCSKRTLTHGMCRNNKITVEYILLYAAKNRAQKKNVPFNLQISDIIIPEFCPVLGIKLESHEKRCYDNSPTVDRIIPELGYVKGNIEIISHKANSIKQNATTEDIYKVADWLKARLKK